MLSSEIKQVNGIWRGKVKLDSWNTFFGEEKDIDLNIGGDMFVEFLDTKHNVGYEYLMTNQSELLAVILQELLAKYPIMQEEYGFEDDELDKYMPNIVNIQEFKDIIKPKRIYILNIEKEGMVYLGFHFKCTWDEENDYGIMLHKKHVVKMGGADTAFLSWIAEEDKNTGK